MKIIRQIEVFALDYLEKMDVLIIGRKVLVAEEQLEGGYEGVEVEELSGEGKVLTSDFIDCHLHILDGGGGGGCQNRTPEVTLSRLITAGVTTVVGCPGTDGGGRDMTALISKVKDLKAERVSVYAYESSYRLSVKIVTDSIIKDFLTIDKVVGIGETAVSDHRSSRPSFEEFAHTVADACVGDMLSGKAGIINVHLGEGKRKLELLIQVVEEAEIPITQFLPTHVNRTPESFEACMTLAERGGTIDFIASGGSDFWRRTDGEVCLNKALKRLIEEDASLDNFTMTSNGQGSLSYFDENNHFLRLEVGSVRALLVRIKEAVQKESIPLEIVLRVITSNPTCILKLGKKGKIEIGADTDLCILDREMFDIDTVTAKGEIMVQEREVKVWGTFEKSF